MPTLNDRYWATLGNPDLLAEDGYSSSAGWEIGNKRIGTQITVFQLILDNWILWQPGNDGRFRPNNLRKVRSRGLEWRGHYASGLWHWEIKGFYQFVKATNEKQVTPEPKIPWVSNCPIRPSIRPAQHSARTISLACAGLPAQQFTGQRFSTTDNTAQVDGFLIGTFLMGWTPTPTRPRS